MYFLPLKQSGSETMGTNQIELGCIVRCPIPAFLLCGSLIHTKTGRHL